MPPAIAPQGPLFNFFAFLAIACFCGLLAGESVPFWSVAHNMGLPQRPSGHTFVGDSRSLAYH